METIWAWHPPVGVWIGVLGFLGVLVPLIRDLPKIGKREKAVWTFVIFALLLLEVKSVYQDRNEHDKEQIAAHLEQLKQFREISRGLEDTIRNSNNQFSATMSQFANTTTKLGKITNLASENLKQTTGGDSWAYLNPQIAYGSPVPFIVFNAGKNILTGVTAKIYTRESFDLDNPGKFFNSEELDIGTLHAKECGF
jgi:hypothetical protein